MDKKIKTFVEAHFKRAGLEGFLHGGGLEFYVNVGYKEFSPRRFDIDHRILTRAERRPELVGRLNEIAAHYKSGIEIR